MKTVMVSGGFDPLHTGHLALFSFARSLGDRLLVVVETDEWVAKKHPVLLAQYQRKCIVSHLKDVSVALMNHDVTGDCSDLLRAQRPDIYVTGPDHADGKFPEAETCRELGIQVVHRPLMPHVDGVHSSQLITNVQYKNPIVLVGAIVKRVRSGSVEVLVARRGNTEKWEILGGFVEAGETLEQAVEREVREESGLNLEVMRFYRSYVGRYYDGRDVIVAVFEARTEGEPVVSPECGQFRWERSYPDDLPWSHEIDKRAMMDYFGVNVLPGG